MNIKRKKSIKILLPFQSPYTYVGIFLWCLASVLAVVPIWPHIYYRLSPATSEVLADTIANTLVPEVTITPTVTVTPVLTPVISKHPLPPKNVSLPEENGLIISSIGVRGEIHEGGNWKEILKKGIWRAPDFGTPETYFLEKNNVRPTILAAHRWGYVSWSASFRKLNSFYNLPSLVVGDQFELIWNQREYKYEVEKTYSDVKIRDYGTDLILYTCELWNSPKRFFVVAKRIN